MGSNAAAWLDIVDTLDVPTLFVLCALGFWRIVRVLHMIETRLAVYDHRLQEIERTATEHAIHDTEDHRRIFELLESARREAQAAKMKADSALQGLKHGA